MSNLIKDANLVVIGAGGAGLASAVTAMQSGLDKIIVLEKSPFTGGNSLYGRRSHGLCHHRRQARYRRHR